jgi:phytoene dehydrogenase-like protein
MSERIRDVVVVGGGHNGLACAAYLARSGLDVLVLERRAVLGGAAVTEEPWPGYRVSTASYVVSLMPPRVVRELDLPRFGYRTTLIEPDYWVPYPDGTALTLWGEADRTAKEIAHFSKADADAYVEFDRYLSRLAHLVHGLLFEVPPNLRMGDLRHWVGLAGRLRRWNGTDVHELVRLFTMSAADLLDEWFEDDRVKGALATQAIIGAWCGPMSPGSAYVLLHHWMGEVDGHEGAWGWVHGGMGALSRALADAATAAGAEVRADAPVKRVVVDGGRARGVELADGSTVAARRVVSSAHPITTYLDLVGPANLSDEVVRQVRRYRTRSGSVKVNLALGDLPRPTAWDGPLPSDPYTGLFAISPSIDYLEQAWDDAKYGRVSEQPYVEAVFPTVLEPGIAPAGKHVALCFTQFGPFELRGSTWEAEREAYGRKVVQTIGAYVPGFEDAVEHMEVLAPPDIEERFGLLGGSIFQGEMTPDQMFCFRPIPGYADYRSPVRGLYLCGSGTHPGGGVMAVPGKNCARVVARDAKRSGVGRGVGRRGR